MKAELTVTLPEWLIYLILVAMFIYLIKTVVEIYSYFKVKSINKHIDNLKKKKKVIKVPGKHEFRDIRTRRGITLQDVADATGISTASIGRVETGSAVVSDDIRYTLEQYYRELAKK